MAGHRGVDHALAIFVAAYVDRDVGQRLSAFGFEGVGHDHVGALARRAQGRGAADAARAAGDEQGAAGEAAREGLVGVDGPDVARHRVQGAGVVHEDVCSRFADGSSTKALPVHPPSPRRASRLLPQTLRCAEALPPQE